MININFTIIIQVINFIFLMWFLNKYLFKPILKVLDERDNKISGDFENAEKINKEVDEGLENLQQEFSKIRMESSKLKNNIKNEGSEIANKKIEKAQKEAKEYMEKFYKELEETKLQVKKDLENEINVMAKSVASLLLGK